MSDVFGQNAGNHASGEWQVGANQLFQLFAPMLGLDNRKPNFGTPLGMSQAQLDTQPFIASARAKISADQTSRMVDSLLGGGTFGKLGGGSQTLIGTGVSMLSQMNSPLVSMLSRAALGYDPMAMMNMAETQRGIFLRQNEFLGAGSISDQQERQLRIYSAAGKSWGSAIAIGQTQAGKDAMANVWAGRTDEAYKFATMMERGGARGLFSSSGAANGDVYNKWVSAGSATGNVMQTKDVDAIYDSIQKSAGGLKADMDPEKMKASMDGISKMAHYLDISSKKMKEVIDDVQETIRNTTGSRIGVDSVTKMVGRSIAQGKMAGLTPEQSLAQVGWDTQQESIARNSRSGKMMQIMMLDDTAGLSAEEKKALSGASAQQIATKFRQLKLDSGLLDNDVYMSNLKRGASVESLNAYDESISGGRRAEYALRASNAAVSYSYNAVARHAQNVGRGADMSKYKLEAFKGALGGLDADTRDLVNAEMAQMEAKGAGAAAMLAKGMQLTGLSGDELTKLQAATESGATKSAIADMEKNGAFDNTVIALKASGGLSLNRDQINELRKTGDIDGLRAASVFKGDKGAAAFNRIKEGAARGAKSELEQARQGEKYASIISKYGGDAEASKAMMAYDNLGTLEALVAEDNLDYDAQANLEIALKDTGVYNQDQVNSIMRGGKDEQLAAIKATRAGMKDEKSIYNSVSGKAGLGLQGDVARLNAEGHIASANGGPTPVNTQPVTGAEVVQTVLGELGKLVTGLTSFGDAVKAVLNVIAPENNKALSDSVRKSGGRDAAAAVFGEGGSDARKTVIEVVGNMNFGGTPVAPIKSKFLCAIDNNQAAPGNG